MSLLKSSVTRVEASEENAMTLPSPLSDAARLVSLPGVPSGARLTTVMSGGEKARKVTARTVSMASSSLVERMVMRTSNVRLPALAPVDVTSRRNWLAAPGSSAGVVQPVPSTAELISFPPAMASKYFTSQPVAALAPVTMKSSGARPLFSTCSS